MKYPTLPYGAVRAGKPEAQFRGVSQVARSPRWFIRACRASKSNPGRSYLTRLIKIFGTTDYVRHGFFILPDGRFLNGTDSGYDRDRDHRQITIVIAHTKRRNYGEECRTTLMERVMAKTGLIRWMPEQWWAQVVVQPTAAQVRTLFDLAQEHPLTIEVGKTSLTYNADWADNIGRDLNRLTR